MKIKLFVLTLLVCPLIARAEFPSHPYSSVVYTYEQRTDPHPQKIYVAAIDLTDPNVRIRVSRGGPDPDGDGKWTTTLMQPTKIADREHFDLVINGDFFEHLSGKDAEGAAALKEFQGGTPATVHGPAVTDGKTWAIPPKARAAFIVDRANHLSIKEIKDPPESAFEVIAGSDIVVKDGKNVAPPSDKPGFAKGPHPRTAVGIAEDGKVLLLVVIDGRKKDAYGMSLEEVGDVMLKYGAKDAVNLDGGGSSVLAIRDPSSHKMDILNVPSDGRERSVGNVLGVSLHGGRATTRPSSN